ncbi:hypothetical protein [Clostridium sp. Ade.TY]|uniref:hypothetical protein n=1 Tax=Clostridium sp. Ade.TY TaxID=1391647 RepID=UPI000410222A|nr:hypothetical protein [Clostridium sp. Ade.TY]
MARFLKFFITSIVIVTIAISMYTYSNNHTVDVLMEDIKTELFIKGCEGAVAISEGEKDELYIAYNSEIVKVDSQNKIKMVLKDYSLNIDDLIYKDGTIYILSNENLISIDKEGNKKILKDNLLYKGENIDRNLLIKENSLLISIGAATNSGIAEKDGIKDISPINLQLNNINYGKIKTGAFKNYGEFTKENEVIVGEEIGNASIIEFNIQSLETTLFASGIRNIESYDINSKGEVYGIVGGIENKGERAVIRDSDYVYNIKKGLWYGWPDFSGGNPISSPRFTDSDKISELIKNPPEKRGQTPYYEHNDINSLKQLVVDKDGVIINKDEIILYDEKENTIYCLTKNNVLKKMIKLDKESKVLDLTICNNALFLLDSENGYIYKAIKDSGFIGVNIPNVIIILVSIIILIILGVIVIKLKRYNILNKK